MGSVAPSTILAAAVVVAVLVLLGLLWEHGVFAEAASWVTRRVRRHGVAGTGEPAASESRDRPVPGTSGRAATALRPYGRVVVAGIEYEAKSQFEAGRLVRVVAHDGAVLTVRAHG